MITKRQALELYDSQAALARALGLKRQAVHKWPWDEPLREVHELKLRYVLHPEHFGSCDSSKAEAG